QRVIRASKLEGAGALQVLALEEDLRAGPLVDAARRHDWSAMRGSGDLPRGAFHVGKNGKRRHFSFPSSSSYTFRIAIGACERASVHELYSPKFACLIASFTLIPAWCRRVASPITASSARRYACNSSFDTGP